MKKEPSQTSALLRQKAEELLKEKLRSQLSQQAVDFPEGDMLKTIHELQVHQIELSMQNDELKLTNELQVHQIELEMQNDELMLAVERANLAAKKYSEIYEHAPSGFFTLTIEGEIIELNNAGAELLGKKASQLINSRFGFFVSNDNKPIFMQFLENVFKTNKKEYCELKLSIDKNSPSYAHLSGIVDDNGQQCLVTAVDITSEILEKENIRQSEMQFRSLFNNNYSIMLIVDPENGEIKDANQAACSYYGWTASEICSKNITEINTLNIEEIKKKMALAQSQNHNHFFLKHRLANGEIKDVEVYSGPVQFNNKPMLYSIINDVTNRFQYENELAKNKKKFQDIFENLLDVYYEASLDGYLLEISPSIEKMTKGQYTRNEMIGKSLLQVYAIPEERDAFLAEISKKGSVSDYEISMLNKDGSIVIVSVTSSFIYDSNANPIKICGSMRDISERKQFENKLAESEKKFQAIIQSQAEGISFVDKDEVFEFINHAATKIFETEDLIGQSLFDFIPPANLERLKQQIAVRQSGVPDNYEIQIITKKGNYKYLEVSATPKLDKNNIYQGAYAIFRDITQRKEAEDSLRKISQAVEQSPVLNYITDLKGVIEYANPKVMELTGYTKEEIIGQNPRIFNSGEKSKQEYSQMYETLNAGKEWKGEFHNKKKNGNFYWVSASISPIIDTNGTITHYLAVEEDITDRKILDASIRQSEAKLNNAQEIAKMGSWELDIINAKLTGSKNYYHLLGLQTHEKQENLFEYFLSLVHPDDLKIVQDLQADNYKKGATKIVDIRLIMPDGKIKWLQNNIVPVFDGASLIGLKGVNIDVTEKRKTEAELIKLSQAINQSPLMICITDLGGNIEYANPNSSKTTGYSNAELMGKNTRVFSSGEMSKEEYRVLWETILSGKEWKGEFHNKMKNGMFFWSAASLSPIIDANGKLTHFLAIQEDISNKKQIEKEIKALNSNLEQKVKERTLQLSEAKEKLEQDIIKRKSIEDLLQWNKSFLELMSNSSPMGYLVVDNRNDEILYFNHRFCQIWEIEEIEDQMHAGELKNNDIIPYCLGVLDDIPSFAESCKPLQDEANRVVVEDEIAFTKNRTIRRFSTQIRGENDEYFGRFYIFEDISLRSQSEIALRESEKRFSLFMEYLPALVFIKDAESKMIYANNAMDDALGASNWIGLPASEIFGGEIAARIIEDDKITLQTGYQKIQESFPNLDGNIHDYETQKFLIPNSGQSPMLGGIAIDITERKLAEEKINKAIVEAENANLSKSEFLSRMSHELRTPLNSILGFAQLLELSNLQPKQENGVRHILQSGKHLLNLINEVLDISRIEAGHMSLSIEAIQLNSVLEEMIDVFQPQAEKQKIKIELMNSLTDNPYIMADNQRLKQVLMNLISNAIKYNKEGGSVKLKTEIMPIDKVDRIYVRISVIDSGLGISQKDISSVFDAFKRIDSEKSNIEGTGLGLNVVKKLMDAMEGNTGVESEIEVGSTFWIELPLAENLQSYKAIQTENTILKTALDLANIELQFQNISQTKLDSEFVIQEKDFVHLKEDVSKKTLSASEKKKCILYIEDNTTNTELIELILYAYRSDIRLITDEKGEKTVQLAIENHVDLIVLDLDLPDIHGSEVLKKLLTNKKTKNIPVVIVSADAMPQQINNLLKSGAKKYITKPIAIQAFLEVLDEWVGK
ncbi:MAG: PAS domain S-box protein [Bacteroidota bacterium]